MAWIVFGLGTLIDKRQQYSGSYNEDALATAALSVPGGKINSKRSATTAPSARASRKGAKRVAIVGFKVVVDPDTIKNFPLKSYDDLLACVLREPVAKACFCYDDAEGDTITIDSDDQLQHAANTSTVVDASGHLRLALHVPPAALTVASPRPSALRSPLSRVQPAAANSS